MGRDKTLYLSAVREAEEMLRIAIGPDYEPHLEFLKERGNTLLLTDPDGFVEKAREHPVAHDAMRHALADMIEARTMPPDAGLDWLVAHLRGEAPRPKDKAGAKKALKLHNAIWIVIRDLVSEDGNTRMKATRADNTGPKDSACDAVADAMKRLDCEPQSYDAVKKIWFRFQKLHMGQESK